MGKPLDRAKSWSKAIFIAFTILTQCWMLSAGEKRALCLEGFRIGSDFRKFKSKYKKRVKCNQTLFPLIQTSNKKETWNRTVNCSSGKGVPVDSRLFYGDLEKNSALDLNAVFESKKLTMLEFIFDSSQFEQLKDFFTTQNGPPTRQQSADSNDVVFAEWTSKDSKIEIQLIPLVSQLTSGGFLRVDSGSNRFGVRVRLSGLSAREDD
jgi:hypothetical protein